MKALIIISLIISIFLLSSIMISIDEFQIKDLNSLKQIIKCLINNNFEECLDYFNIKVYIKIYILQIIPINILKIDNKFIRKKMTKKKNKLKEKSKNRSKLKIKSNIKLKDITINELKININIDMKNSYNVAIATAIGNVLLSYLYTYLFENCNMKDNENLKYLINPKFNNQNEFYLKAKCKISIKILTVLLKVKMYKTKLNVNNTNKFKVKQTI